MGEKIEKRTEKMQNSWTEAHIHIYATYTGNILGKKGRKKAMYIIMKWLKTEDKEVVKAVKAGWGEYKSSLKL